MKQIFQSFSTGTTELVDTPAPTLYPGHVLIATRASLISVGTERMLIEFGRANYLDKARQQPEKVRQVIDKVRTDGLGATLDAVRSKLDKPFPLGYCNAGIVLAVGDGVTDLKVGDRVASNGGHAEVVAIPRNLVARIPNGISDAAASFTVLGAIALQGVRLAEPTLGERFVVTGLGLVGLLTVQLLRANGCQVLGIDSHPGRLALAKRYGAAVVDLASGENPVDMAQSFGLGRGVDGVIITAATDSDGPINDAAEMCRKRGRVVLTGVAGMQLKRDPFFKKEVSFQVSCSYGPGRYDSDYEDRGNDYPFGYVRWTEQRNFEAVLDLLAGGQLDTESLITGRYPLTEAVEAYTAMAEDNNALGLVFYYPARIGENTELTARKVTTGEARPIAAGDPVVGLIGTGDHAVRALLPAIRETGAVLRAAVSSGSASSAYAGRKFGFEFATTDVSEVFDDASVNAVVISTRHDTHANLIERALTAGKHVFVEKPLAITPPQLEAVIAAAGGESGNPEAMVMVGFNRRFAPLIQTMRKAMQSRPAPAALVMTVNAGNIPADHWTQDMAVGGGRIIGEACHFIDLLRFLVGDAITGVQTVRIADGGPDDRVSFNLSFADGSIGSVHYLANGHKSYPKERLEIFCAGRILQMDNFRHLRSFGWPGVANQKLWRQNKGHAACIQAFIAAVKSGGQAPIPFAEIVEATRVSFEVAGVSAATNASAE